MKTKVYLAKSRYLPGMYKIGSTGRSGQKRVDELTASGPSVIDLVYCGHVGIGAGSLERELKIRYDGCHSHNEWFRLSPQQAGAIVRRIKSEEIEEDVPFSLPPPVEPDHDRLWGALITLGVIGSVSALYAGGRWVARRKFWKRLMFWRKTMEGQCKLCEATASLNKEGYCDECWEILKKKRDRGECHAEGEGETGKVVFRCPGSSYDIDQETCDRRQKDPRMNKRCARCRMRIGGKDDPRVYEEFFEHPDLSVEEE